MEAGTQKRALELVLVSEPKRKTAGQQPDLSLPSSPKAAFAFCFAERRERTSKENRYQIGLILHRS